MKLFWLKVGFMVFMEYVFLQSRLISTIVVGLCGMFFEYFSCYTPRAFKGMVKIKADQLKRKEKNENPH